MALGQQVVKDMTNVQLESNWNIGVILVIVILGNIALLLIVKVFQKASVRFKDWFQKRAERKE
jgi:hypothetical protein